MQVKTLTAFFSLIQKMDLGGCCTRQHMIIAHGKKGPPAFSVSSEKHWQSGLKEIAKVSERPQRDSNP